MEHSRHQFTVLSLPPCHWKWRMRHSALTFANQLQERISGEEPENGWDVIFATDMVNIAELRGLLPRSLRSVPIVLYFHENQLTYPVRVAAERDLHFAYTNFLSAITADQVWFNSAFHRDSFTAALRLLLRRMPDSKHVEDVDRILSKSRVQWPGASVPGLGSSSSQSGLPHDSGSNSSDKPQPASHLPIRVVWASRWEHDKNPELFFAAVSVLRQRGVDFRLSVLGESFSDTPECFSNARRDYADLIDHWGYQASRDDYLGVLRDCDVYVSTADHEFFGIAAVEAVACGCSPVVPDGLAYQETLGISATPRDPAAIADAIVTASSTPAPDVHRFAWARRAEEMDREIARIRSSP